MVHDQGFKVTYCKYPAVQPFMHKTTEITQLHSKSEGTVDFQDSIQDFLSGTLYVRWKVFVEEQQAHPASECDEYDDKSIHISLLDQSNDRIMATVRLFPVTVKDARKYQLESMKDIDTLPEETVIAGKLGRLAVLKEHRGKQFGKILVKLCEEYTKSELKANRLIFDAQKDKIAYYATQGYQVDDNVEEWKVDRYDDPKDHKRMFKDL